MDLPICPEHGPMQGREAVLVLHEGQVGDWEVRWFCTPCREAWERTMMPHRGNAKAEALRRVRLACHLSYKAVADLFGLDWLELNRIESGRSAPPDDETFEQWMRLLGRRCAERPVREQPEGLFDAE